MRIRRSVAIIAVDFHAFPRRFAKCETFGVSPMDVGVGAFVFSAGIVAGARISRSRPLQARSYLKPAVLLVIGIVKAVAHSSVGYQVCRSSSTSSWRLSQCADARAEVRYRGGYRTAYALGCVPVQNHVSEYGTHWNFFFTYSIVTATCALALASCLR